MWDRVSRIAGDLRKPSSQLEADLKEVTSDKNWGAPNTKLQGIALQSKDPECCQLIAQHVWQVLGERSDKFWRRIQKTLALVEVLLKYGSDQIIDDIRRDVWRIQHWKEHRVMEQGKEVGGGIRAKASTVIELCSDQDYLAQERTKAMALSAKMGGMGTTSAEGNFNAPSALKSPFQKGKKKEQLHGNGWKDDGTNFSPNSNQGFSPNGYGSGARRAHFSEHEKDDFVQQFVTFTGASRTAARDALERSNWDVHNAINKYFNDRSDWSHNDVGGQYGGGHKNKPGPTEQRRLIEQVQRVTNVDDSRARDLLESSNWSTDQAIEMYLNASGARGSGGGGGYDGGAGGRKANRNDASPSGSSGSEESSSSGSDREGPRNGGREGVWTGGSGLGQQGRQGKANGSRGAGAGWPDASGADGFGFSSNAADSGWPRGGVGGGNCGWG
eukprot:CAMPEP_0117466050 /NCGR_PEP_ID=MMETSP0784-20121206/4942_1 /TAXON_ID=39447 /ORGANISM="" /LENGTH=441 /DNA_ID=CAMNT_0005259979 /DNA_START=56 /DNA_END=1378 /DNA_ORIENTATION=-